MKNYDHISKGFTTWKSDMKSKYCNNDSNSEFSQKMEVFMNHLLFLYEKLSPEGRADIEHRSSFEFEGKSSIYWKFFEMMKESPWRPKETEEERDSKSVYLYESVNEMAQWKLDMKWMGKRLYCIACYDSPLHLREYKELKEHLAAENCELLWNIGAPKIMLRRPPLARPDPFNDENESPLDQTQYDNPSRFGSRESQLTGLLRGLRTYA